MTEYLKAHGSTLLLSPLKIQLSREPFSMNSYTRNRGPLGTKQNPSSQTKFLCCTVARAATSALNSSLSCSSPSMRFTAIAVPSSRIPLKTNVRRGYPSLSRSLAHERTEDKQPSLSPALPPSLSLPPSLERRLLLFSRATFIFCSIFSRFFPLFA